MEILIVIPIVVFYVIVFIVLLGLSFLPTIMAFYNKHPDILWIFIVNFGLGGFVLPWIFALVWACKKDWLIKDLMAKFNVEKNKSID